MYQSKDKGRRDNCTLIYPVSKLEMALGKDEKFQGELVFRVQPACEVSGLFYSNHYRICCLKEEFVGEEITLSYEVDTNGLEEGEEIKGEFSIITDIGEYYLPFDIEVREKPIQSSMGEIRNLFHFVNLARTNWEEAVGVFYHPRFRKLFTGSDRQYLKAYTGLSLGEEKESNVEEFLLLINKKQPVMLAFDVATRVHERLDKDQYSFTVKRTSWGYTNVSVQTDASFIELDTTRLTQENFEGNSAQIFYRIRKDNLHAGKNWGAIVLEDDKQAVSFEVRVEKDYFPAHRVSYVRSMKKLNMQMMENYICYRVNRQSKEAMMDSAEQIIAAMNSLNPRNVTARLYQTELLLYKKHYNEAKWILKHVKSAYDEKEDQVAGGYSSEKEMAEAYAYYLYLQGRLEQDSITKDSVSEQVEILFKEYPDSFGLMSVWMRSDERLQHDTAKQLEIFNELYQSGVNSPMLYLEVLELYKQNPTYLRSLSGMELQVLRFAAKYKQWTPELIERVNYLAGREREFSEVVFRLLKNSYEMSDSDETLKAMVTLLVKSGITNPAYFEWYEKAVEAELRITRLYDFYLLSCDLEITDILPRAIYLYFAYRCELGHIPTAFLYANVLCNRDMIPDIFKTYEAAIESFVKKQIMFSHINENLAYLYRYFVKESMIDQALAQRFFYLLFMHRISDLPKEVRYVVIIQEHFKEEKKVPVFGGEAYVPVYSDDYTILLEKADKSRSVISCSYKEKRLFETDNLLPLIAPFLDDVREYSYYFCEKNTELALLTEKDREHFEKVYRDTGYQNEYRKRTGLKLMQYFFDYDRMGRLDEFLEEIALEELNPKERGEVIKYYVLRDMGEKAYAGVMRYGFETVALKYLSSICKYAIAEERFKGQEKLTKLSYFVFEKGKHSKTILTYLAQEFEGTLKQMRLLWEICKEQEIDASRLAGKMITRTLFSGAFIPKRQEIFNYYYEKGANPIIVEQYLSQCAYQYFVEEQVMDTNVFAIMLQVGKLTDICKLAVVHFFSQNRQGMTGQERKLVKESIMSLLQKDICFPFFNCFADMIPALLPATERTYIEYHTKSNAKVVLHYVLCDGKEQGEYRKEVLKEIYEGFYVKSFVLLFGEKLQYYITENIDGKEVLTESATLERGEALEHGTDTRFSMLNQMAVSALLMEEESWMELAKEYARKSYVTDKLFQIR